MEQAQRVLALDLADITEGPQCLSFFTHALDALRDADALIVMTEWKAYRRPDFAQVKQMLRYPIIFDGRNLFEPRSLVKLDCSMWGSGDGVPWFWGYPMGPYEMAIFSTQC